MEKYTVKYAVTTKSRYGAYIYKDRADVDANNEADAKVYVKANAPKWFGFKKCSVSIISVKES